MTDLGISYAAAATIMTAYFWTHMAVQLPVGVLTDRLGPPHDADLAGRARPGSPRLSPEP
jgi:hypothetical protein